MARSGRDVSRLLELLEEVVEAVEEENPNRRLRKLETVREKIHRARPAVVREALQGGAA